MSTLVGYGSSDEDDDQEGQKGTKDMIIGNGKTSKGNNQKSHEVSYPSAQISDQNDAVMLIVPRLEAGTSTEALDRQSTIGPVAGPSLETPNDGVESAPQSPYSLHRALVRDLTLPTVPNLAIPDSPPGSPDTAMEQKLAHFSQLKKQGFHFNERLANSTMVKNPNLLGKLMETAGMEESEQYASTLPKDIWDPNIFPLWAYKEELGRAQVEAQRQREESQAKKQREHIDFISSSSGPSSRAATPASAPGRGLKGSAAERVMAGLDRDRTESPHLRDQISKGPSNRQRRTGIDRIAGVVAVALPRQRACRPRDDIYGSYDHSYIQQNAPVQHTQSPIVTGTSVLAVKFKDGVVIAADNLASYGSLARFTDVKRLRAFNSTAVLGIGGDVSDMQYIDRMLNALDVEENYSSEGHSLNAKNLHTYLSKVMYKRRSDMNPLWNATLVAGLDGEGKPFLSSVDLLGTTFSAPTLATGYGSMLAQPLLRKLAEDEDQVANITREAAVEAIQGALNVLFYRDARSMDRYSIAVITKEGGVELKEDERLEQQSWAFADQIKGYGTQTN